MPFQPIEPRRLYRQIADQLRTAIQSGEYPVGAKLPTERELAASLGVSRPSVREALIALEVEGLVEVRISTGIFVTASEPLRRVDATHGPLEIIRARQLIEGELAAAAAQRSSPALVAELEAALQAMAADIERKRMPIAGDREFHLCIAQASENGALLDVVVQLFDERNGPLFTQFGSHFEQDRSWRSALDEHRAVVAAIAAGDPQAARQAMSGHLQRSHDRFAVAWPSDGDAADPAPVAGSAPAAARAAASSTAPAKASKD
jgi:GntR family transcriptional regulator, transcriptional repressor for pyruvate dehydrogenase complex